MNFLAIDFETANRRPESACAIGVVRVESGNIHYKKTYLIKPLTQYFEFTDIHGITWDDVKRKPSFGELWNNLKEHFTNIDFIVAHNASFDKRVLNACCNFYGVSMPPYEFKCTVKLSRKVLGIRPANLPHVCRELGISLRHHDAGSDTEACARIMIEVLSRTEVLL
jgi:DNA polymerase III subunit epsilon